ncbi:MAG: alginate export family protein [Acidobacteriota bacterium]
MLRNLAAPSFLGRALSVTLLLLLTSSVPLAGEAPDTEFSYSLRLRHELFDTPAGNPAADRSFDFGNGRLRLVGDIAWERVEIHGVLQGAASFGLPENGAFGIGPVYTAANGGETDPDQFGLAELSVAFVGDEYEVRAGRQRSTAGFETKTGVQHLDGIKKRRLAERLVGNWDWVNVGRRYDGLSAFWESDTVHLAGYAYRPLAGGVNYEDAFDQLDDLTVVGATVTGKYGGWLPSSELRFYGIQYEDDRPGARAASGGELSITTLGASALWGGDDRDLLIWSAFQSGDWGVSDHQAFAFLVEGGRKLALEKVTWTLRAGLAQASGGAGDDHETFFNLLPTNHKFYGSLDYSAFQNLRDVYLEGLVTTGGPWKLRLAGHLFELVDRDDAWYGGSGAFDEARLGFAARRPGGGSFRGENIGSELDLDFSYKLPKGFTLAAGGGFFFGGDAAEEILVEEADGSWAYLQVSWSGKLGGD